jgi:hypothetical protein
MVTERFDRLERRLDIVEHDVKDLKQTSYRHEHSLGKAMTLFELAQSIKEAKEA